MEIGKQLKESKNTLWDDAGVRSRKAACVQTDNF